jgi:ribosomal protein S27E
MHIDVDPSGHRVEIPCPECGQKVVFTLNHAGSSISCRGCGIDIEIVGEKVEIMKRDIESARATAR